MTQLPQWQQLKEWFASRQPRERMVLLGGAILATLLLIYGLGLMPLYKAVAARSARVTQKQNDLAWMQSIAPQLRTLSSGQTARSSGESMVVLVANTTTSSNISAALTGQTPDGQNGVRVRFEGVQFDALVLWMAALQKDYGIQITAAEINRSAQPGQVNANLSLVRNGS